MDAPLAQCTREEQRAVVRFFVVRRFIGDKKFHQRLLAQYGGQCTIEKQWYMSGLRSLKTGRTSVKNMQKEQDVPSTSTSEEKIEQAQTNDFWLNRRNYH